MICNCPAPAPRGAAPSQQRHDYIICTRCAAFQHIKCFQGDASQATGPENWRCNSCYMAELEKIIKDRVHQQELWAERLNAKRRETDDTIMEVLWRRYCDLPNEESTPQGVRDHTKLHWVGNQQIPEQAVPEKWAREVQKNLDDMMAAGGKKAVDYAKGKEYYSTHLNERLLTPWRALAVELLHRGTYRGQREKFGILGEVLGLLDKGAVWKGTDTFEEAWIMV